MVAQKLANPRHITRLDFIVSQTHQRNEVLVAYATKYGSTQEVAEAVASVLSKHDLEVEIQPAREVRSLDFRHRSLPSD